MIWAKSPSCWKRTKSPPVFQRQPLSPQLFLLSFARRDTMCRAMLRFQEHYESPKFRNKIFTLAEFKRWYPRSLGLKRFTYYSDWGGFNIPSSVLKPFYAGQFKALSPAEKRILNTFKDQRGKFYVIATAAQGSLATLHHEVAHAIFYLDADYRTQATRAVGRLNRKEYRAFTAYLAKIGYTKQVFVDEAQATLASASTAELKRLGPSMALQSKALRKLFLTRLKALHP